MQIYDMKRAALCTALTLAEMQLGMPGAQKVGVYTGRMKRVREGGGEGLEQWVQCRINQTDRL